MLRCAVGIALLRLVLPTACGARTGFTSDAGGDARQDSRDTWAILGLSTSLTGVTLLLVDGELAQQAEHLATTLATASQDQDGISPELSADSFYDGGLKRIGLFFVSAGAACLIAAALADGEGATDHASGYADRRSPDGWQPLLDLGARGRLRFGFSLRF